jgi:GTP pyrophosphokinase
MLPPPEQKNKIRCTERKYQKNCRRWKELLTRKLKHLKVTINESVVNDLVNFFQIKTSLDLFYRVGMGSIENQQQDFAAQRK